MLVQVRPLLLAAGITILSGALGAVASQLIYPAIKFMAQESVIGICASAAFCFAATLFKVQDA